MSTESDTGVLIVSLDGQELTRSNIAGDVVWVYAVVPAAGRRTGGGR